MSKYRVYAGGTIIHEDEFDEWDNGQPYYDDYGEYDVPDTTEAVILIQYSLPADLVAHVLDAMK